MGAQAQAPKQGSSAAYPDQWMLLAPYGECKAEGSSPLTADPRTVAATRSSLGHLISVALRVAPPPALSRLCVSYDSRVHHVYGVCATVVAAHGDSLLIRILDNGARDYFVYNVGAAAGDPPRPPSLSLLQPAPTETWRRDPSATGLVRRGNDELVVAELLMSEEVIQSRTTPAPPNKRSPPKLLGLRSGEWNVKRPRISFDHRRLLPSWKTSAVVPLGDGNQLCWVDFSHGVIFADVFSGHKTRTLRYLPYPAEAKAPCSRGESFLCIDPRGAALNLVNNITPRQDMVRTWTLNTDDMAWVLKEKDGEVEDPADLWSLDCFCSGNACVQLVYPVVSPNRCHGEAIPGKNAAAAPTEPEDDHVAGKGQKRQIDESTGPRRSKRVTKRNVRLTGTEWANRFAYRSKHKR